MKPRGQTLGLGVWGSGQPQGLAPGVPDKGLGSRNVKKSYNATIKGQVSQILNG